jgi:hypothetical protein
VRREILGLGILAALRAIFLDCNSEGQSQIEGFLPDHAQWRPQTKPTGCGDSEVELSEV